MFTSDEMILKEPAAIPLPTVPAARNAKDSASGVAGDSDDAVSRVATFAGADGTKYSGRIWLGRALKPAIVYLHGIEGHSQWFEPAAEALNSAGYSVYAPDRRGAGLNFEQRGHLATHRLLLNDIELLLARVKTEKPGSPIFLFGNCWGAKAAAFMCSETYKWSSGVEPIQFAGLILTCPALFTRVDLRFAEKVKLAFDVLRGGSCQLRQIAIPIETHMFTDNATFLRYIEQDPLRLKNATSRFYFENFILGVKAILSAKRINLPVLLMQSDKDEIVDVAKVESWFGLVNSSNKTKRIFRGASHSLDFDSNFFAEYIDALQNWMEETAVSA